MKLHWQSFANPCWLKFHFRTISSRPTDGGDIIRKVETIQKPVRRIVGITGRDWFIGFMRVENNTGVKWEPVE